MGPVRDLACGGVDLVRGDADLLHHIAQLRRQEAYGMAHLVFFAAGLEVGRKIPARQTLQSRDLDPIAVDDVLEGLRKLADLVPGGHGRIHFHIALRKPSGQLGQFCNGPAHHPVDERHGNKAEDNADNQGYRQIARSEFGGIYVDS